MDAECEDRGEHVRYEKISKVMCKLNPSRLSKREMELLLKVLIHHIDHAIAKPLKQKKRTDERKGGKIIFPLGAVKTPELDRWQRQSLIMLHPRTYKLSHRDERNKPFDQTPGT
ncbi:MAG: hypothetical protein QE267_11335 [Akkermansiaceae bacterium]|nr:hypothetical protein [Akkermansiaceae bacterium]